MSKTRMSHRVSFAMTLWLTLVWLTVFSSIAPVTILSGVLIAVLVQLVLPMPRTSDIWHLRAGYLTVLVLRFMWNLVLAGLQVSGLVLSGKKHEDGIVECNLASDNPVYATIVAAMSSMVPGTVVLEVEHQKKVMYLHCLDLPKQGWAAGVRKTVAQQEKRVLLAFGTDRAVVEAGYGKYLPLASRRLGEREEGEQE